MLSRNEGLMADIMNQFLSTHDVIFSSMAGKQHEAIFTMAGVLRHDAPMRNKSHIKS